MRRLFWSAVATAIFAALVVIADVGEIIAALRAADPSYLVLAAAAGFSTLMVWAVNWYNFFQISDIRCSFARTFQLFSASRFLNLVTPLGQFGGQPVMAYLISKESETSYEKALATLSSADLIVIMPISVFVLVGYGHMALTGAISPELRQMSVFVSGLAVFGIFMGYMGWYHPSPLKKILFRIFSVVGIFTGKESVIVDKIDEFLENLESSYRSIGRNPRSIMVSFLLVHVAYLFKLMAFYAVILSLGIDMSVFQMMLLIPLVSVANFSPTPGGAGTFEAAMTGLIVLFVNVDLAVAVTAAVLYRVSTYWMGILVGYVAMTSLSVDHAGYREMVSDRSRELTTRIL